MENGRQGGWEGREGANVSGATGPPVWSRNRAQRRAVFGEVSAASPHENTPRRPRGEGGYGSTALTAHTPERGGRAERRREMVGSGSEGGCGEGWCPSPPSPPSTTGAAPPRGELLPPRCLCHLLSASAATAAATASDAAVGGWLLGKQWREGPTYRFPMAAAAVVGRRKGGGGTASALRRRIPPQPTAWRGGRQRGPVPDTWCRPTFPPESMVSAGGCPRRC